MIRTAPLQLGDQSPPNRGGGGDSVLVPEEGGADRQNGQLGKLPPTGTADSCHGHKKQRRQ